MHSTLLAHWRDSLTSDNQPQGKQGSGLTFDIFTLLPRRANERLGSGLVVCDLKQKAGNGVASLMFRHLLTSASGKKVTSL